MNVKNFDRIHLSSARPERSRGRARPGSGPTLADAVLGIVCVVGVFGVLWLLYMIG